MKNLLLSFFLLAFIAFTSNAQPGQGMPPQGMGMPSGEFEGEEIFSNEDVVFHVIDEHTWVGTGHLSANESIYLIEGNEKAVLLDAGSKMTDLDKIVASITDKPVTLILTHVHPDHVGAAKFFPEVYINPADQPAFPQMAPDFKGEVKDLVDGEIIDLGGRQLEVVFTPGHSAGSTTFIDKEAGYGFSGDSFGSGNLLLFSGPFSVLQASCEKASAVMEKEGIEYFYPGHYRGNNPETKQRIDDMITLSKDIISGKVKGEKNEGAGFGFNNVISAYGVRISYSDESIK